MFSSMTAFITPRFCCTSRKAARLRRVMTVVIYNMSGSKISVPMANCQLSRNMETMMPPRSKMLVVNWIRPLESTRLMASVSLVTRLIKSPTLC